MTPQQSAIKGGEISRKGNWPFIDKDVEDNMSNSWLGNNGFTIFMIMGVRAISWLAVTRWTRVRLLLWQTSGRLKCSLQRCCLLKWKLGLPHKCDLYEYFDAWVALLYFAVAEHSHRSCIPSLCFCLSGKVKEERIKEKLNFKKTMGNPSDKLLSHNVPSLCVLEESYLIPFPRPQITTFAYYQRLQHWCVRSSVLNPFF